MAINTEVKLEDFSEFVRKQPALRVTVLTAGLAGLTEVESDCLFWRILADCPAAETFVRVFGINALRRSFGHELTCEFALLGSYG